jgi:hypothetical protein
MVAAVNPRILGELWEVFGRFEVIADSMVAGDHLEPATAHAVARR